MDGGGAAAPETAGAGPGGPRRASGGPVAGGGGGAASAGRVCPDGPDRPGGGAAAGSAADRVWAVLLLNPDPIEWAELAQAAGVRRVEAMEALFGFENAGLVLHIPAQRYGRFPNPDLWVLAGGVREQQRVSDAVRLSLLARLSADSEDGTDESPWPGALEIGVIAPLVPIGPVTGLPVLPRGYLKALVAEQRIEVYPQSLSTVGISQRLGGRSAGAIRGAADALVREGRAVCTDPAFKKYAVLRADGTPVESPGSHEDIA